MTQTHSNTSSRKTAPAITGVPILFMPFGLGIPLVLVFRVVLEVRQVTTGSGDRSAAEPVKPLPVSLSEELHVVFSVVDVSRDILLVFVSATVPLSFQRLLAPTSQTHAPYIYNHYAYMVSDWAVFTEIRILPCHQPP